MNHNILNSWTDAGTDQLDWHIPHTVYWRSTDKRQDNKSCIVCTYARQSKYFKNALDIFLRYNCSRDLKVKISINSWILSILNQILSGYNPGMGTI